jgi:hypothetical protein
MCAMCAIEYAAQRAGVEEYSLLLRANPHAQPDLTARTTRAVVHPMLQLHWRTH